MAINLENREVTNLFGINTGLRISPRGNILGPSDDQTRAAEAKRQRELRLQRPVAGRDILKPADLIEIAKRRRRLEAKRVSRDSLVIQPQPLGPQLGGPLV